MKTKITAIIITTVACFLVLTLGGQTKVVGAETNNVRLPASVMGDVKCAKCHEEEVGSFAASHHFRAWSSTADIGFDAKSVVSCEKCHGPGDTHSKDEDKTSIISFSKKSSTSGEDQSKQCLNCHANTKLVAFWKTSGHARNDVSCATCHKMHMGGESAKPTAQTCFACHKDIETQVKKRSHHPILEGKVSCSDCHNPHGTLSEKNLKAENINQLCYKCHGDKRGPFLWEHPPVEENCLNCHAVHGSLHDKLLIASSPGLCFKCHESGHGKHFIDATNAGFGGKQLGPNVNSTAYINFAGRACLNCHAKIHGSYSPPGGKMTDPSGYGNAGGDSFTR